MSDSLEIATLCRLLESGTIKAGVRNAHLVQRFDAARWIKASKRKAEWVIRLEAAPIMRRRLDILLPTWQDDCTLLRDIGRDPFEASDIEALPMLRRQTRISGRMINRRNWNAAAGLGPKHTPKALADGTLTKDWVLRFRPNNGIVGIGHTASIDFGQLADIATECLIPERAWRGITGLAGTLPKVVITCENLGAYIDLPVDDSILVVFAPGTDTEPAVSLLRMLPAVPWMHFGDLDPEGIDIASQIASELGRDMKLLIPTFADDYLDAAKALKTGWGAIPEVSLLNKLKANRKRIFQEVFMLDDRMTDELAKLPYLSMTENAKEPPLCK